MTEFNRILNYVKGEIRAITPVTGTTTNDYVEVVSLDSRWLSESNLTISNTAAVNELIYKVTGSNDYASGIHHEITSNTVAVSDSDMVILRRHAEVKVYVKSAIGDNHTTYQIDGIFGR